ncbi:hypothetical protein [Inquilinus sp. CAU 1745]
MAHLPFDRDADRSELTIAVREAVALVLFGASVFALILLGHGALQG